MASICLGLNELIKVWVNNLLYFGQITEVIYKDTNGSKMDNQDKREHKSCEIVTTIQCYNW